MPIDEAALTDRIVADLQRQIDLSLEHRLQAAVAPLLERLVQTCVSESCDELALTLRDVVAKAVSQEIAQQRSPSDPSESD